MEGATNTSTVGLFESIDRDRERWLHLLRRLVNMDSGTHYKAGVDAVVGVLAPELERLGLEVSTIPQSEVGDHLLGLRPSSRGPSVLLVGHTDTVFPTGTAAARPFRTAGDRAYGPGVADMRGGIVVMLAALSALRSASPGTWDRIGVRVILNSDEEPGSDTSRQVMAELARQSNLACILEPGRADGSFVSARKGSGRYTFVVRGQSAHSGEQPELGANAVAELAAKIGRLHRLNDLVSGMTVNVGVISGGTKPNIVPDSASCEVDVRFPNDDAIARFEAEIPRLLEVDVVPRTVTQFHGSVKHPPSRSAPGFDRAWSLLEIAGKEVGIDVRGIKAGGASDGNVTSRYTPTIDGMGPAGDLTHSEGEYIDLRSVAKRTKILARFIELFAASG